MKRIIGIDEVGRGALAGPVVVAAAVISGPTSGIISPSIRRKLGALKDSKKLSAKRRELWYAYFSAHPKVAFAIARVYPREIERRNISNAANLAAKRAFRKLVSKQSSYFRSSWKIFLDGGLYLANKEWQGEQMPTAKTMVKADEKISAVKIASIIAKVHRDRFMHHLAKRYPAYAFEIHKGYGTKQHREAVARYGPCAMHRLTFLASSAKV